MQAPVSRGPDDVSHEDQGQAGASGRSTAGFLFCAKEASACAESGGISQRFPFPCYKTKTARTAGRRSSPSPPRRHDQKLCMRRPPFDKITCTICLPSNLAVVGSLPAFILGEEDQGHYIYSLATTMGKERSSAPTPAHTKIYRPPF